MEPPDRLESWKEIAAYLKRDVRTVQRWEAFESLPVHRHLHKKRGSVYALRSELDAWRDSRTAGFFTEPEAPAPEPAQTQVSRSSWMFSAIAVVITIVAVMMGIPRGPINPGSPVAWDPPRLLGEVTRDGGTWERIPIPGRGEFLALSPDGRTLYAGFCRDSGTSGFQAIDTGTRATLWVIERFGGCGPVVMSQAADRAVTGDKTDVVILDVATRAIRRIATPAADIRDFALAPNGRILYVAALFKGLLEIDTVSGHVLTKSHLPCPMSLSLAPAVGRLYVGYQCSGPGGRPGHDAIEIFDTHTGTSLGSITNLTNVGGDLEASPDGSRLWADGSDACVSPYYDQLGCPPGRGSIVNVIRTSDATLLRSLRIGSSDEFGKRFSFSRDGSRVVAGNAETGVISTASLTEVEAIPLTLHSNVVFSPDGRAAYSVMGEPRSIAVLPIVRHPAPPAGLTARWSADGVYTDSAGGNDIPKESRGAFVPGRIGRALEAGSALPIRFLKPPNLGLYGYMTAMAWVKIDGPGTIMEFASIDAEAQFGWRLQAQADGRPTLCIGRWEQGQCGGPRSSIVVADTPLTPGRWHHVAFTRSDETVVLYVNGRSAGTATGVKGGLQLFDTLWLRLGSDEAGRAPLRGSLDEIELYNRTLSPAEVEERGK